MFNPNDSFMYAVVAVVIAFVVALAIIVGLLDTGSSFLVKKLIAL